MAAVRRNPFNESLKLLIRRVGFFGVSGQQKSRAPDSTWSTTAKVERDPVREHKHDRRAQPGHERLSDREFQILRMIGEGKTIKEIAGELALRVPTVSTYRARILNKLEMKNTAQLVKYALTHEIAVSRYLRAKK